MTPSDTLIRELRGVPGLRLWPRAPLAPFTTIGVGGRSALLVTPRTSGSLSAALEVLERHSAPWAVLGAGSNLLVSDRGFDGVVLKLDDAFAFVEAPRKQDDGRVCLVAGAAAVLARLSAVAADRGLSGLEFACGIPGTVGGGVIMNAGAHGVCLAAVLSRIQVATAVGVAWWDAASLPWGYRWCGLSDDAVVVAAEILLREDDPDAVRARQHGFLRARGRSQPRGVRTFGSTFKNPTGDAAGRLLDAAGLKGVRRGGAEVSSVHANFITNSGDATAADVVSLMRMMWEAVRHQFGVELEPEVHHLGVAP